MDRHHDALEEFRRWLSRRNAAAAKARWAMAGAKERASAAQRKAWKKRPRAKKSRRKVVAEQ